MSVRVLLVDDHPIIRDGLRTVLMSQSDLYVVGETGDGLEVIPMVEKLQPDVLVLDLMLPGLGGLEITRQIRRCAPQTRVVILSMHDTEAYVAEAFNAGAMAYVLKKSASRELVHAIRAVLDNQKYLSPPLSEQALEVYRASSLSDEPDPYKTLTPRERQVLHLVTEGMTNQQIALRLNISTRTIEMHRANLMRKLRVRSTAELVRYAVNKGIQPPE